MHKKIWIMNHYASDMFRDKAGRHYWFARKLKEAGYSPIVFCANTFHNKAAMIDTKGRKCVVEYDGDIPYIFVKTRPSVENGSDRILNMALFFRNLFPVSKIAIQKFGHPDIILASSVLDCQHLFRQLF